MFRSRQALLLGSTRQYTAHMKGTPYPTCSVGLAVTSRHLRKYSALSGGGVYTNFHIIACVSPLPGILPIYPGPVNAGYQLRTLTTGAIVQQLLQPDRCCCTTAMQHRPFPLLD